MAKILSKSGIGTGTTVQAGHVTQSIDAFTGTDAYDITLSGSLVVTGSITGQPGVVNALTASYAVQALTEITKEVSSSHANFADTASFALGLSGTPSITTSLVTTTNLITTNLTASGNISSSGNIIGNNFIQPELTTGRVLFAGLQKEFATDADLTFSGDTLSVTKIANIDTTSITASGNTSFGGEANFFSGTIASSNISSSGTITSHEVTINDLGTANPSLNIESAGKAIIKLSTTHASTNRAVGINISASSNGQEYALSLDRANNSFTIAPSNVDNADTNKVFELDALGNITSSGAITASGDIIAKNFSTVGKVTADTLITTPAIKSPTTIFQVLDNLDVVGQITASGNISSSGTIIASNLSGTNTGDQNISNLAVTGSDVIFNHITASGNISSSGNIIGNNIIGNNLTTGRVLFAGLQKELATDADLTFSGDTLSVTKIANIDTINITASGAISASHNTVGAYTIHNIGGFEFAGSTSTPLLKTNGSFLGNSFTGSKVQFGVGTNNGIIFNDFGGKPIFHTDGTSILRVGPRHSSIPITEIAFYPTASSTTAPITFKGHGDIATIGNITSGGTGSFNHLLSPAISSSRIITTNTITAGTSIGAGTSITAATFIGDGSSITNLQRPITSSLGNVSASNANAGFYFRLDGSVTVSIQSGSVVACDIGNEFEFFQTSSAGAVLFKTGSNGVTLNSKGTNISLAGQFSGATLKKIASDPDEWDLIGDLG